MHSTKTTYIEKPKEYCLVLFHFILIFEINIFEEQKKKVEEQRFSHFAVILNFQSQLFSVMNMVEVKIM